MIKVAHLFGGREGGGIANVLIPLLKSLNRRHLKIYCLFLSKGRIFDVISSAGISCIHIQKHYRGDVRAIRRIAHFCQTHQICIIHTHSITGNFYGRFAGMLVRKLKIVTTIHAFTNDELRGAVSRKWFAQLLHTVDLQMSCFSHKLITPSYSLKDDLIARNVHPQKITVITHGMDFSRLSVSEAEINAARADINIQPHEIVVGIIGRLTYVKNHQLFLNAAKLVSNKHSNCRFLIVGEGPLRRELQQFVENLSIEKYTHFTGWVRNVSALLRTIDILVLTSLSEGFGFVLLEGMACGATIVATRVSDIPRIISDKKTGFLVSPDNPIELAETLDKLLQNSELRHDVGKRAQVEIKERFSIEAEVQQTRNMYLDFIKQPATDVPNYP